MRRIQCWLLSLYPRLWRERYEEEFVALLEQYTPSWRDLLNIFFNALYEQISALSQKGSDMLHQQKTDAYYQNNPCTGLLQNRVCILPMGKWWKIHVTSLSKMPKRK